MKLSDIDFSALGQMFNSMSDEEKEHLNDMAENMMASMQQGTQEEQEEEDFYTTLGIDEEEYSQLPGIVLDQIEAAVDLENYYSDFKDADYSASVLFYAKAILNLLRTYHYPIYQKCKVSNLESVSMTTLQTFFAPLSDPACIHRFVDAGFGTPEGWMEHVSFLQQLYILWNRAQFDMIRYEELQSLKDQLFGQEQLLKIMK